MARFFRRFRSQRLACDHGATWNQENALDTAVLSFNYLFETNLRRFAERRVSGWRHRLARAGTPAGNARIDPSDSLLPSRQMNRKPQHAINLLPAPRRIGLPLPRLADAKRQPSLASLRGEIDRLDSEPRRAARIAAPRSSRRSASSSRIRGSRSGRRHAKTRSSPRSWPPARARSRRRPCGSSSAS